MNGKPLLKCGARAWPSIVARILALLSAMVSGCGDDFASSHAAIAVRWSPPNLQLREGEQAQVALTLEAPPSRALILELRLPPGIEVESEPLLFTSTDHSTPRLVMVRALHDDDATPNRMSVGVERAEQALDIDVVDDDELVVVFDRASVSLSETTSTQIEVTLAAQPLGEARVSLRSSDPVVLQLSQSELVFTSATWRAPQRVTLHGAADLDGDDEWVELRSNGPVTERTLAVHIIDRERQSVLSDVASLSMDEGFSRVVMLRLRTAPKTPVTVHLAIADSSIATASPTSLVFTRDNYAEPQRVTVQSLQDFDTINGSTMLVASTSGIVAHSVGIEVIDQTVLGLTIAPRFLSMAEGDSAELSVQLSALPQAATTVTCAPLDASAVALQPSSLTFQPQNWNVPQPIAVLALDDPDNVDELVSVVCGSPSLTSRSSTVQIADDDPRYCGDGVCSNEEWESCACQVDCEELGCPE